MGKQKKLLRNLRLSFLSFSVALILVLGFLFQANSVMAQFSQSLETTLADITLIGSETGKAENGFAVFNRSLVENKYSNESVELYSQLIEFGNDYSRSRGEKAVDITKYPLVKAFFEALKQRKNNVKLDLNNTSKFDKTGIPELQLKLEGQTGVESAPAEESSVESQNSEGENLSQARPDTNLPITDILNIIRTRIVCGYYGNPKPAVAAPWTIHRSEDPVWFLGFVGYHRTPDYAGGGWTLPKDYIPRVCKSGTFRDHAIISTTDPREFRMQQYYDPIPGEPNPEIWRTPWPYADWGTYVYWWHENH